MYILNWGNFEDEYLHQGSKKERRTPKRGKHKNCGITEPHNFVPKDPVQFEEHIHESKKMLIV